jgi:hypothetical protein
MNRREWMKQTVMGALVPACVATSASAQGNRFKEPNGKKGWAGGDAGRIEKLGAQWYYTWWHGGKVGSPAEYVPMIKRGSDIGNLGAVKGMGDIKAILSFNEPERADQGNTSIDDAIKLWPRLVEVAEAKNVPLSSPAPSSDDKGMQWLTEFMKRAKREKLRVDFIAIHWYRSRDADAFATWLKEIDREWRLPIWLTEFNGWSGSERENYAFLRSALRTLDRSRSVERYAYFEPGKGKEHSLFKEDGSLSRMG